jgi:hypothetical protein
MKYGLNFLSSPDFYRGKVLEGEVAEAAEESIRNFSLEKKALPKEHRFPQLKRLSHN